MRALLPLLLLAACDGGSVCVGDTEPDENGECVEVDTDSDTETDTDADTDPDTEERGLEDILIDAQPCQPLPAEARLDVDAGCVDGVCARSTLAQATRASGRPPQCGPGNSPQILACSWPSGVTANVWDGNEDGQAQPAEYVYSLTVQAPFGGASPDGLGLGVSPGCFVETFGKPTTTTLYEDDKGNPMVGYGYWEAYGVVIQDIQGGPTPYRPDGRVDIIALFGPPQDGG